VDASNQSGIWAQDGAGARHLVARTGAGAPGAGNAVFSTLGNPVYNHGEAVAFLGTLKVAAGQATAATAAGIWSSSSGSLALVARRGTKPPGFPIDTTFNSFNVFALPDQGGVVFMAAANTGHRGIWAGNSAADLHLLVKEGDTFNGRTIAGIAFLPTLSFVNGQTRSFAQGTGNLVCLATFNDKTTGILKVTGTTLQSVAQSQDSAAGATGARFSAFGNPAVNANGDVAFKGTLSIGSGGVTASDQTGIWADDNTNARQLIARTGDIAPGTSATFLTLNDPIYNDNEAVAFRGTLKIAAGQATSSTDMGVWSNNGGSLALVAQKGSQAPGCPTGATFSAFTSLALPNQGGVILLAALNSNRAAGVTSANNTGIWAVDTSGVLHLIVRKGDVVSGKSIAGLSFLPILSYVGGQSRNFTQGTGDLVYEATFSDKTTAIFVIAFP
jgi:hypothetical protein